jgi:hypothetical protein
MEDSTTVNNEATGPVSTMKEEATGPNSSAQEESSVTDVISIQDIPVPTTSNISISSLFTIDDILGTIMLEKESNDRAEFESISNMPIEKLKQILTQWAKSGFPNRFEVKRIGIVPPAKCVDGLTRNIKEYIQYCSGKTIEEHVAILQTKLSGMILSIEDSFGCLVITVSKA